MDAHILGFSFDTTGLVIRLEMWTGSACWWSACPHHHYELHVKKVGRHVYGDTSSPDEQIYKKFQAHWNKLIEQGIDYNNLELFNWKKVEGTCPGKQVFEVLIFCKA